MDTKIREFIFGQPLKPSFSVHRERETWRIIILTGQNVETGNGSWKSFNRCDSQTGYESIYGCNQAELPVIPRRCRDLEGEDISVKDRFARSWEQRMRGELRPVSELWDGIDAE